MKNRTIATIMTQRPVCVSPDQKIIDVKHIYEKENFHHHIPVTENDELVGIVSLVDFMYNIKDAGYEDADPVYHKLRVKDIMTTSPSFLDPSDSIEKVARELAKGEYHAVPIVEKKKVVGIVSTVDVINHFLEAM